MGARRATIVSGRKRGTPPLPPPPEGDYAREGRAGETDRGGEAPAVRPGPQARSSTVPSRGVPRETSRRDLPTPLSVEISAQLDEAVCSVCRREGRVLRAVRDMWASGVQGAPTEAFDAIWNDITTAINILETSWPDAEPNTIVDPG